MARAKDKGDRFPSDIDDAIPVDSQSYEVDYVVNNYKKKLRSEFKNEFLSPRLETVYSLIKQRESWKGIIVNKNNDGTYVVALNDGNRLNNVNLIRKDPFEDLFIGDPVTVVLGNDQQTFLIEDNLKPLEIDIVKYSFLDLDDFKDGAKIQFKERIFEIPVDSQFSNKDRFFKLLDPFTILIDEKEEGDYLIDITIQVDLQVEGEDCCKDIVVVCPDGSDPIFVEGITPDTNTLAFNSSMFKMSEEGKVSFINATTDLKRSILNTTEPNKTKWTDTPQLKSLDLTHWVKLNNTKLYSSDDEINLVLPEKPQTGRDFLVAEAFTENTVKLAFRSPGKTGTLNIQTNNILGYYVADGFNYPIYETIELKIENGLIASDNKDILGDPDDNNVVIIHEEPPLSGYICPDDEEENNYHECQNYINPLPRAFRVTIINAFTIDALGGHVIPDFTVEIPLNTCDYPCTGRVFLPPQPEYGQYYGTALLEINWFQVGSSLALKVTGHSYQSTQNEEFDNGLCTEVFYAPNHAPATWTKTFPLNINGSANVVGIHLIPIDSGYHDWTNPYNFRDASIELEPLY